MPIFTSVSVTPSVSLHPAVHFVRSIVKPSGPVTLVPSAAFPKWFSLIRSTIAWRSLVHSASHSSMEVGSATASAPEPGIVVEPPIAPSTPDLTPGSIVPAVELPPLSSPPQAVATRATTSALAPRKTFRPRTVPHFQRLHRRAAEERPGAGNYQRVNKTPSQPHGSEKLRGRAGEGTLDMRSDSGAGPGRPCDRQGAE